MTWKGIDKALTRLEHFLPDQAPLRDFIHHNTLHAFQDREFYQALKTASHLFGSRQLLSLESYRRAYKEGKITEHALKVSRRETEEYFSVEENRGGIQIPSIQELIHNEKINRFQAVDIIQNGIRRHSHVQAGIHVDISAQSILFRIIANYLDQGVAYQTFAVPNENFWVSFCTLLKESALRILPVDKIILAKLVHGSSSDFIETALRTIVKDQHFFEQYVLELLLNAPGWAGMIRFIENNQSALTVKRQIKLADYIALYLAIEWSAYIENINLDNLFPAHNYHGPRLQSILHDTLFSQKEIYLRIWHSAMELSLHDQVLSGIVSNIIGNSLRKQPAIPPDFQALFCVDDRSESMRRHIEEICSGAVTFSTPGHFGIDCMYMGPADMLPAKQCPAPVKPSVLIKSAFNNGKMPHQPGNTHRKKTVSAFQEWLVTQTLGLWPALRMFQDIFYPTEKRHTSVSVKITDFDTDIYYERTSQELHECGLPVGYTVQEMALRAETILRQIGLTHNFAPIVIVTGHGASSANNPYFSAYDCGACSGKPGAPNARVFAMICNRPDVRNILSAKGIGIPAKTLFVAALHDTTRDKVYFFDEKSISGKPRFNFLEVKKIFEQALRRNAKERIRRFETANPDLSEKEALAECNFRSGAIFEPRPEYNHATNAVAIVGSRYLTGNLFLDRRAFFNSYDFLKDKNGTILEKILGALIPVCAGINLEYFFSRTDNEIYGAGSKLPHNIVSLLGVSNGADGDLRTGLPWQMVEIHDPLRLLVVIEQKKEVIVRILRRNSALAEWIQNGWVLLSVVDTIGKKCHRYVNGELRQYIPAYNLPESVNSERAFEGKRGNLPVQKIRIKS